MPLDIIKNTGKERFFSSYGMTTASVSAMIASAVAGLFDYRGVYDASSNAFPSSGGSGTAGAILKGDTWRISVAGQLGTEMVEAGDFVVALVDTPGSTASNWSIWQGETNSDLGYNVKDYGLKGDGSTDDRAALNTLLNTTAATGSTIYFPPGTYNISSVITVSNKYFHFIGNEATIAMTGNSQILDMSSTVALTGAGARWTFEGLAFNGTGAGGSQSGLYFSSFSGLFEVSNCLFTNWGNTGIAVASTQNASTTQAGSFGGIVTGCRFYNNTKGINLLDRGEYIQITNNQFLSNTTAIYTIGGNSIIDGNTISYNGTGIEITTGTNSGKDIIANNQITHNTSFSINAHDIASTQGLSILDNHIILSTLRIANTTGVSVSGGLINSDAYIFDTNTGLTFTGVKFNTTLANTITLVGNKPNYIGCFNFSGDAAIDADNFTPAALLVNNGNEAKPIQLWQDNGTTIASMADTGQLLIQPSKLPSGEAPNLQVGSTKLLLGDKTQNQLATFIEYFKGNGAGSPISLRGAAGFLGTTEMNLSINMDYTTNSHLYYDPTLPAAWTFLGHGNGFGLQYVPANNPNVASIYTTYGCDPFKVEYYNQPVTGKGINGFSKLTTGWIQLTDLTNTSSVTNNPYTLQYSGGTLTSTLGGSQTLVHSSSSLKLTQATALLTLDRVAGGTNLAYITMAQGATIYSYIGIQRADGTGLLTSAEANSTVINSDANKFYIGNSTGRVLKADGKNIGIQQFTPTAYLHLGAGTTAASTAPLKFTTGTSMTSAEAGAMEFTTDDLFFTISTGAARKGILLNDGTNLVSGRVPFVTTNGRLTDSSIFLFNSTSLLVGTASQIAVGNVADFFRNQNAATSVWVSNNTSGTAAQTIIAATSDNGTTNTSLRSYSAGFTTSGIQEASTGVILTTCTAGLNVGTFSNTQLSFWTNNTKQWSITSGGILTAAEAKDIAFGTSTGTKIGTATSQKIGFWNATPIIQPASANQAMLSLDVDVTGVDLVDRAAINTNFANIQTLVNQLRSDLVSAGLIKGSA